MKFRKVTAMLLSAVMVFSMAACGGSGDAEKESASEENAAEEGNTETSNAEEQDGQEEEDSQEGSTAEKTQIVFMGFNKEESYANFFAKVEELVPEIEIEYQYVDSNSIDQVMSAQLAAGGGPDIIGATRDYAKMGYLVDLSEEDYIKDFNSSALSVCSYDDKVYGIPAINWFEGIFYNKDIFEEYNLEIPDTWEEYLEIHKTLTDAGVKAQTMGAQSWEPLNKSAFGFLLCDFYPENPGFDISFDNGEVTMSGNFNEPLSRWAQLIEDGYLTSDMLGVTYDQALEEFATGKAAMWESGPWAISTIEEKNPDLNFGMFPFVPDQGSEKWLVGGVSESFAINANSDKIDLCKKVLEAMASDEALIALCNDRPGSQTFKIGLDVEYPEEYADCEEALSKGNVYCPWDNWQTVGGNALIMEMGSLYQAYLGGAVTLDEAVQGFDEKAEDLRSIGE